MQLQFSKVHLDIQQLALITDASGILDSVDMLIKLGSQVN